MWDRMEKDLFEEIVEKDAKKIFNYLLKSLRNKEDAEDLLQEVFLAFYKKMETVEQNYYLTYLFRIAYHKSINFIKKQKRKPTNLLEPKYAENIIEEKTGDEPDNEILLKALQSLKPKDRLILEMQFYQNMSYKDIAEALMTTVAAVDAKLVRAKKQLRNKIMMEMKKEGVYINERSKK